MATAKKTAEAEPEQPEEAAPESTEFVSFIKDGPTQDDLNPAYAPPKDEGAGSDSDS